VVNDVLARWVDREDLIVLVLLAVPDKPRLQPVERARVVGEFHVVRNRVDLVVIDRVGVEL
jgi:hypothetical protein